MAQVVPYQALRFTERAGDIAQLACPPYDIISETERQNFLRQNPYNIIRLELPRDGADPYAVAGDTLHTWLQDGILAQDQVPAFYIYDITFDVGGEKHITGLIGRVHLEEFEKGVVLPHEFTLSKAKTDRLNLMHTTGCNFSNIYSLYREDDPASPIHNVSALIDQASLLSEMTDAAGLTHRLWALTDQTITAAIVAAFADHKLYIADGHHRYETALNYRKELLANGTHTEDADYCMMMLVEMSHPGLVVFPTHRIVRDLPQFSANTLLAACEEYFDVKTSSADSLQSELDAAYAAEKKAFGFYDGAQCAVLTLKDTAVMDALLPDLSAVSRQLDVSILHTLVLERLLHIDKENMANQINLTYTRDSQEALHAVENGTANCCFLLNPTRVSEIRDVAAAGEKMPQKSTYFYPKLITGLTMNKIL